ncbi:MAG TPA: hypothetical protein VMU50_07965 [Polyangia bacterium]|nr:hypothetical protein [Polyangia bacterium]
MSPKIQPPLALALPPAAATGRQVTGAPPGAVTVVRPPAISTPAMSPPKGRLE